MVCIRFFPRSLLPKGKGFVTRSLFSQGCGFRDVGLGSILNSKPIFSMVYNKACSQE